MRSIAHITAWAARAVPRLLTVMLVLGLLAPSLTAGTHSHEHSHSAIVTAEAAHAASDASPDEACLVCHVNCGCHIGLPFSGSDRTAIMRVAAKIGAPISDQGRFSALSARLNRPPRI